MKDVPVLLDDELIKECAFFCFLIRFDFDTTLYYTNLDLDVYYNGHTYNSRGLEFTAIETSTTPTIDNITFEIDNVELEFSSLSLNQELRGKVCEIRLAVLSQPMKVIASDIIFTGFVSSIDITPQRAKFTIYDPFLYWKTKTPRRRHQSTCPWLFKGTECQYAGAAVDCDKSYDRCQELDNTVNFGGFRWLPYLQDKEIWWGRTKDWPNPQF